MVDPASPEERLYTIVRQGLCIGCGLCQSIAGKENLSMTASASGYLFPRVSGALDHDIVDRIHDTCPGVRIEGLPQSLHDDDTRLDNVWGPWRRMVRAWAAQPEVRHEGSTGGVLTALAQFLLESGRVNFILHARASSSVPAFGEMHLSFNRNDVLVGAGSRYGPTAVLINIGELLDRGEPFAFIGKPCDIAALRNYARHDQRVDQQVRYWLTPVCGGFTSGEFTRGFMRNNGIDPAEVRTLRYRGRGCPGPTRIETEASAHEFHYLDFWGEDESQWSLPHRCKLCPDGIGEAADLAAADTWPGGSPRREETENDPGTNAVIARTRNGEELLAAAIRAGAISVDGDITPDEMSYYQMHQMRKKYAVWPRYQGLADEGRIVPRTARLRIRELAAERSDSTNEAERQGLQQRVREARATENWP